MPRSKARRKSWTLTLIFGEHRYLPGEIAQHTIRFPATRAEKTNLGENWASAMATALGAQVHHNAGRKEQVITTTMGRPAGSPACLVTWGNLHLHTNQSGT